MNKNKKKNKKKGFTLIEILVAVLIIGILSAIALPSYNRAVEKSRASGPMANLASIAKAQNAQKLGTAHYTDNVGNLDISLTDEASGQRATGSTFESEYFTYRVYGDDKEVALATRKNVDEDKKYELSVDYKTNKLYCRPITNKTCIDLHLEEGQDYSQVPWEDCLFAAAVIKNPISCYTRNNNGAQERMECFDNGECEFISEMEGYKFYAECYATDTENGFCTSYYNMYESTREEDEESIWTHTRLCNRMRGLECLEWGDTIDNFYWKK